MIRSVWCVRVERRTTGAKTVPADQREERGQTAGLSRKQTKASRQERRKPFAISIKEGKVGLIMMIAVVTGATSGMGRECAIQLWEQFKGLDEIWAIGRRKERLEQLKDFIGIPVRTFDLDLTEEKDLERLKAALTQAGPQVKFLVNAAGFGKIGGVRELSVSDQTGMAELNCTALTAVTSMVLPFMPNNSRILQFASSACLSATAGLCGSMRRQSLRTKL